jgi:hypothetical protein
MYASSKLDYVLGSTVMVMVSRGLEASTPWVIPA